MLRGLAILTILTAAVHADPLDDRVAAIGKQVSALRGLRLRHPIPSEMIDRAELRARLEHLAAEPDTAAATAAEAIALERWGTISPGTDYAMRMIDAIADRSAGYYATETKKLTLVANPAEPDELVIAHELERALDDQAFGLDKLAKVIDGDAALARRALIEGDGLALVIEMRMARDHLAPPWGNPELTAAMVGAMSAPADDAPLAVREALLFPARDGLAFVAALRRRASWSAVDAAFRRPPRSTEQVMHVEKYLADEAPIAVGATAPASLAGYAIARSTVWGEHGFQVFLRAHGVAPEIAARAAAGWGGDRAIVMAREGEPRADRAIGVVRTEWDTEADAIEAQAAALHALDDAVVGATIEATDDRTRWLAIDGTEAWVERRGNSVMLAIGVPAVAGDALLADAWTALSAPHAKRGHANK